MYQESIISLKKENSEFRASEVWTRFQCISLNLCLASSSTFDCSNQKASELKLSPLFNYASALYHLLACSFLSENFLSRFSRVKAQGLPLFWKSVSGIGNAFDIRLAVPG